MEFFTDFIKPYIFLSGEGVLIEGTVRIISWDSECIVLLSRDKLSISGNDLKLDFKGSGSCVVSGRISAIEFSPC